MFGGTGFLLSGNMCVGVWKEFIILRVGVDAAERMLQQRGMKPFDITGKAMKGWVMAEPDTFETDVALRELIDTAIEFVLTLPPKG